MKKNEIFEKIRAIIIDVMGLSENEIKPESDFLNDLGCDSLLLAEIIMLLEDKFNIRINDIEAEKMRTVSDVIQYIQQNT